MLEINDLVVSYGNSQVVNGVTFEVPDHSVVSLIGPNGAGKTSILRSIFNYTDWSGEIRFRGRDVAGRNPADIAADGIGYCMEESDLFLHMSVRDNLVMGSYASRQSTQERMDRVYELFPILAERESQNAVTLSGGEQQMLSIGKVLMADPDLLILDEPTLGLAPIVIDTISEALTQLRSEATILLVEQNVTFGMKHADEIVLLETGSVVSRGSPSELQADEHIRRSYLGM